MSTPLLENTISKKKLDEIIDFYQNQNKSLREISRITGYNRGTLSRMLERLGIKTIKGNHYRKYFFDFDFFKEINSELSAYWLGVLYADGCILSQREYGEQTFKLQIAEQDIELLQHYKEDLKSTYPIRYDDSHFKRNSKWQRMCFLEQRSQQTVNDLKRLGCVERKSLILDFPKEDQVPEKYIYHFIRGYFDGDGSISCWKERFWLISFVGTENFIKKLATYFHGGSVYKDKRRENSWYFSLGGNKQVIEAYHLMYDNSSRYMERKFNKFQQLLTKYSEN